ncbi:MAG: TetR/AcrR family transcriptional regulator [Phycisphaerae bacterium]
MRKTNHRKVGRPVDAKLRSRRREEILEAATSIFARRGYSKTDLQVVADMLGVGKGTIYRYFPSKRALFLAAADWGMNQLHEQVEKDILDIADPLERIEKSIYSYLLFFDSHPQIVELLIQERAEFKDRKKPTYFEHRDERVKQWRELTQNLIAEGRMRDIPVDQIMDVVGNLLYGTMFTNFFVGRVKSCRQQVSEILDVVFKGVLSEKARKQFRLSSRF